MASREQTHCCSDARAGDEIEWWGDEEIVARILCRLHELKHGGCDQPDCIVLAGRLDVDLDNALTLIARGCPPSVAVRILA